MVITNSSTGAVYGSVTAIVDTSNFTCNIDVAVPVSTNLTFYMSS